MSNLCDCDPAALSSTRSFAAGRHRGTGSTSALRIFQPSAAAVWVLHHGEQIPDSDAHECFIRPLPDCQSQTDAASGGRTIKNKKTSTYAAVAASSRSPNKFEMVFGRSRFSDHHAHVRLATYGTTVHKNDPNIGVGVPVISAPIVFIAATKPSVVMATKTDRRTRNQPAAAFAFAPKEPPLPAQNTPSRSCMSRIAQNSALHQVSTVFNDIGYANLLFTSPVFVLRSETKDPASGRDSTGISGVAYYCIEMPAEVPMTVQDRAYTSPI